MSGSPNPSISEPIPISLINGRYLLFDVDVVTYLRRTHHICGTFIGGIPQVPQQNTFHGLPLQLMPEEAKLLVEKEVAYIVDDPAWHRQNFTLEGDDKKRYLESIRAVGLEARKFAEATARKKTEMAMAKYAARQSRDISSTLIIDKDVTDPMFTVDERPSSQISKATVESKDWGVTPATSYSPSSLPVPQGPDPAGTSAYPLFAHLHSKNYYIMPGLRFGCNFNVYPGDPLRFHSHFLAVGYDWNEEFSMLDVIGGGRLGTRVKKGFLIGGKDDEERGEGDNIRTFCIEWGGM
jgi:tRNA-splicing endonuclease subunit Sen34